MKRYVGTLFGGFVACGVAISSYKVLRLCTIVPMAENVFDRVSTVEVRILLKTFCIVFFLIGLDFMLHWRGA